jgi:hypothetical protein
LGNVGFKKGAIEGSFNRFERSGSNVKPTVKPIEAGQDIFIRDNLICEACSVLFLASRKIGLRKPLVKSSRLLLLLLDPGPFGCNLR